MTYLALDIETTGLDPHRDKIISVGVYGPDCQEVFTDLDSFKKFDAERKPSYVFHNGSFDLHFLFRNGIDLYDRYWFDTKSVASILYPRPTQLEGELSVFSLQNLCRLFLNVEPWKLDRENLNDKYSLEEIKAYNLKDCEMTWKLMGQLIAKIEVQSGSRGLEFISNWIMPASVLCAKMERNGIEIDKKGLDSYAETIEKKKEELLKQLNQTAARGIQAYHESQIEGLKQVYDMMLAKALVKAKDPKKAKDRYRELYEKALLKLEPFNWSSPTQLSWLLKNYYGLDLENKREQKETTNEAKLRELADSSPVCKALVDFREVDKLCSSSIPALRDNLSPQGRVHARFNVGGTRTGRLSSSSPNLQQVPKGRIREFIIAAPGKTFFIADYAQIEVRVLAHLSQEKRFIEAFKEGIDPYSLIAMSLLKLNCPVREIKERFKKERDVSKTAGLSILYGTGGAKLQEVLAKELGLSYSINKCKEFIEDYRNSFPDLKLFKEKLERSLINQRVSYNLLGRPFVIEDNEDLYMKAFNTLVQGSSSDLVVAGALEIDKVLTEAQIPFEFKMLVHDEIVIEIPEELGSQVADLLEDLMTKDMEQKLNLDVPLKIEYALDKCWRKP
jgi:DNA polymerase I-like protein with 3'-5' exonuclease and polymerase domains